jgi:hypothetical protein
VRAWIGLLAACGGADPVWDTCEDEPAPAVEQGLTWYADVRPIVDARCARCHRDGGPAPLPLTTYAEVLAAKDAMADAVESGRMPPWKAADCCDSYLRNWGLTPTERATLLAWLEQGAPEGDPSTALPPAAVPARLPRVDVALTMAEPYTPPYDDGPTDTSRCFLLDWPEDAQAYVTGLSLRPGNPQVVHHALLLVAGPAMASSLEAQDKLAAGPGWSCPGGVVWGATGWIGGWSPGWEGVAFPDELGQPVAPGSKLILSVHYSVTSPEPAPDQTTVELMTADTVRAKLGALMVYDPAWLLAMPIPAGEADVVHSYSMAPVGVPKGAALRAVNLHMHERGASGQVGVEHADGSTDCLVYTPDYDEGWQYDYWLAEPRALAEDDRVFIECHWDNTEDNQRLVDGVPEEPKKQRWAEDHEMCVAAVTYEITE